MVEKQLVVAQPDERLRHCAAEVPKPRLTDDAAESMFIANTKARGDDCASKLDDTWKSIDDAKTRADASNALLAH